MAAFPFFKKTKQDTDAPKKGEKSSLVLKSSEEVTPKVEVSDSPVTTLVESREKVTNRKKMNIREGAILIRPLLTEKTLAGSEKNMYAFEVSPRSTKLSVKKAFFNVYGYLPQKVRILNRKGKQMRFGGRKGKRKDQKFAFVALKKGEKIDLFV